MDGRIEPEAAEIQAAVFAVGRIVAAGIRLKNLQYAGVRTHMQRVDVLHVGRLQGLSGPSRIEQELASAQSVRRNGANLRNAARILPLLIVKEVENTIRDDLPADRRAELISDQRLPRHPGVVVEPCIGGEPGIAVVFVERTMDLVRAALGDER